MTQIATVKRILDNGLVEVLVRRKSACGQDCADCAGCEQIIKNPDFVFVAENRVNAKKGNAVIVESDSKTILTAALFVYFIPFVLFFLFYGITTWLSGESTGIPVLMGFIGFVIGILISIAWDRREKRKNHLKYWISEIIRG